MKRPDREINIFSLSALDLFAAAMGAFLIIAVILFPYYLKFKDITEQIQAAETRLGECEQRNQNLRTEAEVLGRKNSQLQQALKGCREKLKKTFVAVVVKWETKRHDIDLHVVDPQGNRFYYKIHNRERQHFPDTAARLSVDTIQGPGVEIWEIPEATPGEYRISYKLFDPHGNFEPAQVRGTIYYRDNWIKLPDATLFNKGQVADVGTIIIAADGSLRYRRPG